MKKFLVLTILLSGVFSSTGCSSCGRTMRGWFNRGDSCRTCASGDCASDYGGMLGSPVLNSVPNAPRGSNFVETLPGPVN